MCILRYQKCSPNSEKSKNFIEKGFLQLYAPMRYKIKANFSIFKNTGFSVFYPQKSFRNGKSCVRCPHILFGEHTLRRRFKLLKSDKMRVQASSQHHYNRLCVYLKIVFSFFQNGICPKMDLRVINCLQEVDTATRNLSENQSFLARFAKYDLE